jgi:hypothetical protein
MTILRQDTLEVPDRTDTNRRAPGHVQAPAAAVGLFPPAMATAAGKPGLSAPDCRRDGLSRLVFDDFDRGAGAILPMD